MYGTPARNAGGERHLLVAAVAGDDHRRHVGADPGSASPTTSSIGNVPSEVRREGADRARHRGVAEHHQPRRRQHRLEEDLERAAGQAGVVHDELARLRRLRLGRDPQQQRLAGVDAAPVPARAPSIRRTFRRRIPRSCRRAARAPRRRAWRSSAVPPARRARARTARARCAAPLLDRRAGSRRRTRVDSVLDRQVGPERSALHRHPHLRRRERHVGVADAVRLERVDHGVHDRRWRTDGRRLTDALAAERMVR